MTFFSPQKTTVAQVMSDFQKRVDELNQVAVEQDKEAARQAQIIEDAKVAMMTAADEATYARDLARRLGEAYLPSQAMSVAELRAKCAPADTGTNYA